MIKFLLKQLFIWGVAFVAGFVVCSAQAAELEDWGTIGATIPMTPVTGRNTNQRSERTEPIYQNYSDFVFNNLPISPKHLKNKAFQKYYSKEAEGVTQPLCFVGNDAFSKKWLETKQETLLKFKAICYVVSAESSQDVLSLKQAAGKVPLQPVNGVSTAKELGVTHYPSVTYKGWVSQ